MRETLKTGGFVLAALVLAVAAAVVEPEARTPEILSDQGDLFYPKFKDPLAVKIIEVVDYDEATATARPFQVAFRGRHWVIPTHHDYPVDAGDRLAKTAGALVDLRKDIVVSDSVQEHATYGVIDPLDQKVASLTGRGKRVTLRDQYKEVLADYILGKPVEGKPGYRYVRVPGDKRTYAVKTGADPSARFTDWVDERLLSISRSSIRRISVVSYSIDEFTGRLANVDTVSLTRQDGKWKMEGAEKLNAGAVDRMIATLDNLKIVDVRPKPPSLAQDLKRGQLSLSLETAMSLRQKGFFITPSGRLLSNEGEMAVETSNGLIYSLRFGEVAGVSGEGEPGGSRPSNAQSNPAASPAKKSPPPTNANRYLLVMVRYDAGRAKKYGDGEGNGDRLARSLTNRFAGWYYVIRGEDFQKLRLKRKDLLR